MDKKVKTILIVAGIVIVIAGITVTIYWANKKQKEADAEALNLLNPVVNPTGGTTNPAIETPVPTTNNYLVAPTFNAEKELSNPIQQLKGRAIYPKPKTEGGVDYANVRSSAEVNTSAGWWDSDNQLATIYQGTPIGTVISDTTTVYNGYAYRWFKVKLHTPVSGIFSNYTEGFVRADTVTFKPV